MTTKTKKFGSLNEFTRTHQVNPHLIGAVSRCMAYSKNEFKTIFESDVLEKIDRAVSEFLGEDLNKLIPHPFNTNRLTAQQKVGYFDVSFLESDRGVALLSQFRNYFSLIHKINTINVMFSLGAELKGKTDIQFALKRAESISANDMLRSFEVVSSHMYILSTDGKLDANKSSVFLLIDQLKLNPKDYVDEIKEYFGEKGFYFIAEINMLFLDLSLSHAVSS